MKKKILFISICSIAVLAVSMGIFWYYHPTHYKYNDRFIIGTTDEKIIEKYGEFSTVHRTEENEIACGIYKIRDNTPDLIMSYDDSLWYEIHFKDGVAVNVRLQKGQYGG